MTSPDPDPRNTTGLTEGGSPLVGETPPVESSTSGLSDPEAPPGNVITAVSLVWIGVIVLLVLGFFVGALSTPSGKVTSSERV